MRWPNLCWSMDRGTVPGAGASWPRGLKFADTKSRLSIFRRMEPIRLTLRPLLFRIGHSMGLIGLIAEQVPERIRALVYISGLLPPNGTSLMQQVDGFDPRFLAQIEFAPDRRTARLSAAGVRYFL